jgi:hypothetical protein
MRFLSGRVIGAILIGLSVLWILRIAGALPFGGNRTANQFAASTPADRPPVSDPNAIASGAESFRASPSPSPQPNTTGSDRTAQANPGTTGTPSNGTNGTLSDGTTDTTPTPENNGSTGSTAVRAAW